MIPDVGRILEACASLGCLYLFLSLAVVLFWRSAPERNRRDGGEAVTIMKPLHGSEPRLVECLSSFCTQDYNGPTQLVFGIQDRNDAGALAAAKEIKAKFPALPVTITIDESVHGTNAKISNLINMEPAAANDILLVADSDILAPPNHVEQVVALLQKPGAGAVSFLYHGEGAAGFWSRLSAQCINAHFLPNVLVGMKLGLAKPCFGSTVALRRETLNAIGGFEAFANHLADDYAIGEAVRATGQSVEISSFSVAHICSEESARELMDHQLRWARTIRTIDLPGYLGSFIANPFIIACLGIAARNHYCLGIAALALFLRLALCKAVEQSFRLKTQDYWMVPITDLISFSVYVWSFFGSAVTWKRAHYDVLSDGTLAHSREG